MDRIGSAPQGRRRRLLGTGLALAALAAAITPAATATAAASTTVVHGSVTVDGRPVAGVLVGFTRPLPDGRPAVARTSRTGAFALRAPAGTTGYAWVGKDPGHATVFTSNGSKYVRGRIGAAAVPGTAPLLGLDQHPTTAARLDGGRPLRFRIQRAGRVRLPWTHLQQVVVDNLGGGRVSATTQSAGAFTSAWLAPGTYRVRTLGEPPWVSSSRTVVVRAGRTTSTSVTFKKGATLTGRLTVPDGGPVTERIHVDISKDGRRLASTTSTVAGAYSVPLGLLPGRYSLAFGFNPEVDPVLHPTRDVRPTASTVVPFRFASVTVPAGALHPTLDRTLERAGSLTGTFPAPGTVRLQQADGRTVARVADRDGTFTFGGLLPGQDYRVVAQQPDGRWGRSAVVTATTGATDVGAIVATGAPLRISGTITGGSTGTATVTDTTGAVVAQGVPDGAAGYSADGLAPGAYEVDVRLPSEHTDAGLERTAATFVQLSGDAADTIVDLRDVPKPAQLAVKTTLRGAPVNGAVSLRGPDGRVLRGDSIWAFGLLPGAYAGTTPYAGAPVADAPYWFVAPSVHLTLKAGEARILRVPLRLRGH